MRIFCVADVNLAWLERKENLCTSIWQRYLLKTIKTNSELFFFSFWVCGVIQCGEIG